METFAALGTVAALPGADDERINAERAYADFLEMAAAERARLGERIVAEWQG